MTKPAREYDLTRLKGIQSTSNKELLVRLAMVATGTLGLYAGLGLWGLMPWLVVYSLIELAYARLIQGLPDKVGMRQMVMVGAMEMATVLLWPLLFVILWSRDDPTTWMLSLLIIGAAMTSSMGERSEVPLLRWTDSFLLVTLQVMTVAMFAWRHPVLPSVIVVAAVCLLLQVWTFTSTHNVSLMRQRLARAEREGMERQRIEAIGRLTGGVAHDFNNILTVIGGNLDLAREIDDLQERESLLAEARAATGRAAAVTSQLLAYSRQAVLQPVSTDLRQSLTRVEAFLARLLPKGLHLVSHADSDLPRLLIDPTRFEAALINLILNARDAMPGGGIIRVDVDGPMPIGTRITDTWLAVQVADTGIGIPPEILDRVSEPYFTTKPVGRGSGLGLSMVQGFVEQSGGQMHIRSQPGEGTCVTLWFPIPQGDRA